MNNTLGILGIARKAGLAEVGEEQSGIAARTKKARALFTASDAADNTVRRMENFSKSASIPLIRLPYDKDELGEALGARACAAFALTDAGLAANLLSKLEAESPGTYTGTLAELERTADRIQQRRKEARTHERRVGTVGRTASKEKGRNSNGKLD